MSDHMTNDSKIVETLQTSLQTFIIIVYGSPTPVIGVLSKSLTLDFVFVVPSLSHKFLFVSQITIILTCIVMF